MTPDSKEYMLSLFAKIAEGDMSAYLTVFKTYQPTVFSVALQYCKTTHLAEDASQQVFVALWEKRDTLKNINDPEAWLWTVARNQTINMLRKESTQKVYLEYLKDFFSDEEITPINQLILKQRTHIINRVIEDLPDRQKEVYQLSRNEGLTYTEIARNLGIGTETVKEHMAKALKNIRKVLVKYESELKAILIFFLIKKNF